MTQPEPERRDPEASILSCDYVSLPVNQLDEAVRFYRDVLGLNLRFKIPERWAEFDLPPLSLALYPREKDEPRGGEIALAVGSLPAAMARLEAAGVEFPHGIEEFQVPTRQGRLARFHDSSGNKLELVESP
ncbi:MAG: VOC family protein [Thermoplasmata archaeon]